MVEALRKQLPQVLVQSETNRVHIEALRLENGIDYSNLRNTINSDELPLLSTADMAWMTMFAGLGHLRCLQFTSDGLRDVNDNWKRVMTDSISGKVHGIGSNNVIAKSITELIQRSSKLQRVVAAPMREVVYRNDGPVVWEAANTFLRQHPNHSTSVFLSFHPDITFILSKFRPQLEQEYNRKVLLYTVMTDHIHERPEFPMYITESDGLLAADMASKELAEAEMDRWITILGGRRGMKHHKPLIESTPFALSPRLTEDLSYEAFCDRQNQVDPNKTTPLRMVIPMGGSSPQQQYLLEMQYYLRDATDTQQKDMQFIVVAKESINNRQFLENAQCIGSTVYADTSNKKVIEKLPVTLREHNPAIVITKPSELHVLAYSLPQQLGGSLILFTPPVGDQEHQNLSWMRDSGLLPTLAEKAILERAVINGDFFECQQFAEKCAMWRGFELPNDGWEAAIFINNALELELFSALVHKRELPKHRDLQQDGSIQLLQQLEAFVAQQTHSSRTVF